jgi:hypothetical protein
MEDLGTPGSYLTLAEGTRVLSADGHELGRVRRVFADPDVDVFDGFVIGAGMLPGGDRFVEAGQVEEIFERGVVLTLDAAAAEGLPAPREG